MGDLVGQMKYIMKCTLICFFIAALSGFSGCEEKNRTHSTISPRGEADKKIEELLGYLSNNDAVGIKSMFCEAINSVSFLDKQIKEALDFFEGKMISYVDIGPNVGKKTERGKITKLNIFVSTTEISTTADRIYEIRFSSYLINDEYPDRIGISEITIVDENEKECVIGDFYLVNPEKR